MFRFHITEDEDKNLLVQDVSNYYDSFPSKIDSFLITVTSSRIPNGVVSNLDALDYMRSHRISNEIYKITPEVLGQGSNGTIPDGVYTLSITVNNVLVKELTFVVTDAIKAKIAALAAQINPDFSIDNNDIFINNLPLDSTNSKLCYIIAVYFKLVVTIGISQDAAEVNNLIDKLQRLLTIVT